MSIKQRILDNIEKFKEKYGREPTLVYAKTGDNVWDRITIELTQVKDEGLLTEFETVLKNKEYTLFLSYIGSRLTVEELEI
jgi:uncharacterized protein YjaG (DUF416 family)